MPSPDFTSPETIVSLAQYRQMSREGTATVEDLRAAIAQMRGDRTRAQVTSAKAKTAKAKVTANASIDTENLLSQLKNLGKS